MNGEVELEAPIDSDVDLRVGAQRRELVRRHGSVLVTIAFGGGFGALARYWLTQALPPRHDQFPWATFFTNVLGCLLIGMLTVLITERWTVHRLTRPFLGIGVLGGFTTFSTYAVETRALLQPGTVGVAFTYLAGTFVCAMLAVVAGVSATRTVLRTNAAREEAD
jgi:fluoride exporter